MVCTGHTPIYPAQASYYPPPPPPGYEV
ncbi:hypothetical protein C5167_011306 [Papaver somniferum]|uniref:Uncharacterized protein n=1 Tax=Papaver somniferum TaxID=3469 RepID=A0A4Y7K6Q5_PAPSO|nr:hypothetical protein C5167_011306 [Papaver somniferum]